MQLRAQEEFEHGSWSVWSEEVRGTPWTGTTVMAEVGGCFCLVITLATSSHMTMHPINVGCLIQPPPWLESLRLSQAQHCLGVLLVAATPDLVLGSPHCFSPIPGPAQTGGGERSKPAGKPPWTAQNERQRTVAQQVDSRRFQYIYFFICVSGFDVSGRYRCFGGDFWN